MVTKPKIYTLAVIREGRPLSPVCVILNNHKTYQTLKQTGQG